MRGAFLKTLVALLLLAGLGGYVYWSEKREGDAPKDAKPKVLAFDKAKLKEVRLQQSTGEAVTLVKKGEGWRITQPGELPAGTTEVETLVSELEGLETGDTVTETPGDLKQYGLDPPRSTVTLVVEGAPQPLALQVGATTFDNASVYAKRPNEPRVFLIPAHLAGGLDKKPFDLRDRDLLHAARDKVKALEVTGPEGSYTLERTGKDEWNVTRPLRTRAARWPVDGLLGTLEGLRMEAVAAEEAGDLKPFGLDKPARTVTLTLEDGTQRRLEIGSATGDRKYHAREALSKLVAQIPPALVDDLAKGLSNLRSKRLLEVSTYDVESVEARLEGGARAYARSSEKGKDGFDTHKWKRTAPDAADVETSKVEDLIFKLSALEATEFVDQPGAPASYGLDAPVLELKLGLGKDKPAASVKLGKQGGAVYAQREGDVALLKLDAAKVDETLAAFKAL